jgi:hypothetical protein
LDFFGNLTNFFDSLQLLALLAFVAVASSTPQYYNNYQHYDDQHYHHAVPVVKAHVVPVVKKVVHEEPHHHPKYDFHYEVHDDHTGDIKSQQESRDGDHVQGEYSLVEPDGHHRIVKYSDVGHGFVAEVHREGSKYQVAQPAHHVAKYVAPVHHVSHVAPIHHAPVVHHAPVQVHHVAPVVVQKPVVHKANYHNDHYHSHVSFNGHGSSYNY